MDSCGSSRLVAFIKLGFVVIDVVTGIPHATSKDDVYDGRFIPKGEKKLITRSELTKINITGALVIINVWFVHRTHVFVTLADITPEGQ
jgi:hypothetical protein